MNAPQHTTNMREQTMETAPKKEHEAKVHIDRKPYHSPTPTTHSALYVLGKVPTGYELFLEVQGDEEDKPIPNDGTEIHLKENQHFYSAQVTLNPGV
jgi:hypothetical protein